MQAPAPSPCSAQDKPAFSLVVPGDGEILAVIPTRPFVQALCVCLYEQESSAADEDPALTYKQLWLPQEAQSHGESSLPQGSVAQGCHQRCSLE